MTDETPSQGLLACPLCGSDKVEVDCYARTNEGVCTEPSINCDGCGTIFTFDFNAADPWHEIARRWNTRAPIASIPEPDMRGDVVERVARALLTRSEVENLVASIIRIANDIPPPSGIAARLMMLATGLQSEMHRRLAMRAAIDAACPRHE